MPSFPPASALALRRGEAEPGGLQRFDERLREGKAVAAGCGTPGRDAAITGGLVTVKWPLGLWPDWP